jgi:hypothetical protein
MFITDPGSGTDHFFVPGPGSDPVLSRISGPTVLQKEWGQNKLIFFMQEEVIIEVIFHTRYRYRCNDEFFVFFAAGISKGKNLIYRYRYCIGFIYLYLFSIETW